MSSRRRPLVAGSRERLIESHLPLAKSVAKRYAGRGVDLDDLVQVGAVGLIKAADRFDAGRGVAFSTFAEPTIEGEIRHHLRDRSAPVRIPRELQRLGKRLRRRQGELAAQLGRDPTLSELADAVEADVGDVERALAAEQARESVELPAAETAGGAAMQAEPFAGSVERLLLAEHMHVLDDRERRIVYLRFHADQTERQIARELEISQAHVSRLLAAALAKLQTQLAAAESPANAGDTTSVPPRAKAPAAAGGGSTAGSGSSHGPGKGKPEPTYSGRFLVRMSGELHEQLVQAAARENVSLNRYVTGALADSVAGTATQDARTVPPGEGGTPPPRPPAAPGRNPARSLRVALAANVVVVVLAVAVAVVLLVLAIQRGI
ncbi:MAG TPA: sigma-70 family RNA polymerase sigma factor [Solirubrobacteraceae bacterium]